MRKQPSINEIEKLTVELTWMGEKPIEIYALLHEFEFTPTVIKLAIQQVMNSHSCKSTYQSALQCKQILEYELMVLSKSAFRV